MKPENDEPAKDHELAKNLRMVRIVIHFIGMGKCVEKTRTTMVPEKHLEPEAFVENHLRESVMYEGQAFKYHDCMSETFSMGDDRRVIYYVRYLLDVEKEKFKSFLEELKPSDFLSNPL